jgi:predicted NAD/FAD-dependent oxidoreductase
MADKSCIIVGAGISGLLAARELSDAGWRVTVLDKGRGVGGRMATRRVGGAGFDHGAQFFTVRGERFEGLVNDWLAAGAAAEWSRGFADAEGNANPDGHPRYRGSEGMTSIPKHLASGLNVRTGERVLRVDRDGDGWTVAGESGFSVSGGALLLTAPVPQSLALAESGNYGLPEGAREQLGNISYDPCLAVMALLDGASPVPEPGGVQIKGEPLDWIGDNATKGISDRPALTIHGGPQWSREHYDEREADVTRTLLRLAGERLGADLTATTVETSLARWRYSWVTTSHEQPCLVASEDPPLVFCGDGFGQPKVEGAALSGLAAADGLLGRGA